MNDFEWRAVYTSPYYERVGRVGHTPVYESRERAYDYVQEEWGTVLWYQRRTVKRSDWEEIE